MSPCARSHNGSRSSAPRGATTVKPSPLKPINDTSAQRQHPEVEEVRLRFLLAPLLSLQTFVLLQSALAAENPSIVVSVPEQKLYVFDADGHKVAAYRISTSKFGLGDSRSSYATPTGQFAIATKI